MTQVQIEAGTLEANLDERTVTGLLLPWDEEGNSNLGKFAIERDSIVIPRDASVVTLNRGHKREDPIGRATALNSTDKGIVATFSIANTDEGDEYLLQVKDGQLNKLSAEVKNIVLRSGKAVAGALFGAAAVAAGAFPSAALMAEDIGELDEDLASQLSTDEVTKLRSLLEQLKANDSKTASPEEENTSEAPATEQQPETDEASTATTSKEEAMSETTLEASENTSTAKVPNLAGAPKAPARTTLQEVAHAMANFHATNDASGIEALTEKDGSTLFAALSDIKSTYAGSVGVNIIQPQWVGDVWSSRTYTRKITPLLSSAALTSLKIQGFRFTTDAAGAEWDGDKTAISSNSPATESVTTTATRWAGGHDIAREFVDFSVPEFWESYYRHMANSYAEFTDNEVLSTLTGGADTMTAGTVPSGFNAATVSLVDGAIAVLEAGGTPTFAVVAPDVYRELLLQGPNDVIATLSLSTGLEESTFAGFKIVADSGVASTKALVGDRSAVTFYELPGAPIRTRSLDQIKGGIDEATFGYFAVVVNNSEALQLVTPA